MKEDIFKMNSDLVEEMNEKLSGESSQDSEVALLSGWASAALQHLVENKIDKDQGKIILSCMMALVTLYYEFKDSQK